MRIDPWGRHLAQPGDPASYLTAEETESGIDLVQLRERLRMTPGERLRLAAAHSRAASKMRGLAWPVGMTRPERWPGEGNLRQPLGRPFPWD
ncbi:MAG: hypothetical protein ABR573_03150 [Candidatus Dormibacteria bacterium]|nr:hypothetical protein [Actinomycetota bacterium]